MSETVTHYFFDNVERPLDGVYCADRRLNSVLDAEGLAVLNPEELVQ